MHTQPVFTDYLGKPIRRSRRIREFSRWQRVLISFLIVAVAPLIVMGASTLVDLAHQVKGILPIANGGTNTSSSLTGLVRGGASYTAAELSGDVTTSGSNAATVAKINGTTLTTNSSADQTIVTSGSAVAVWSSIPNCTGGALQYTTSTHLFNCGSIITGTIADAEVPTGSINGVNTAFVFAHTPSPAASLALYKNGQQMIAGGADYTLATATATFTAGSIPQTGDTVIGFYRY